MAGESKRENVMRRWAQLEAERTSWLSHWRELAYYMVPRVSRFLASPASGNRGDKINQHIYDNTATRSVGVLNAGLMAGVSSPARPWFRLRTPDPKLNDLHSVRTWLHQVEEALRDVFNQSNTYRTLRQLYRELGVFGTASSLMLPNYDRVIHHYPMTAGEFALGVDDEGRVDTVYRKFELQVGALVKWFGLENVSEGTRSLYMAKNLEAWRTVIHAVEPRRERDPLKLDNKNMPWASIYTEGIGAEDKLLRESGFKFFPAICPRWEVNGGNAYGDSPGMNALGDVKQLQHQQLRKSQGIDHDTLPALQAPPNTTVTQTPGSVTFIATGGEARVRRLFEPGTITLGELREDIEDVRARIKMAYFEDLFLLITSTRGTQPPTAREIAERHEEKLIMLGPVLESLHDEALAPLVEGAFFHALNAGLIPPPPPEMANQPLVIKFVSLLAQAQQIIGLSAIDRFVGTILSIAPVKPDVLDKLDADQLVDSYADALGVDPSMVVADENVAILRAKREQQQAAVAAAQLAPDVAKAAKDMSGVDPTAGNAIVGAMQQLGARP